MTSNPKNKGTLFSLVFKIGGHMSELWKFYFTCGFCVGHLKLIPPNGNIYLIWPPMQKKERHFLCSDFLKLRKKCLYFLLQIKGLRKCNSVFSQHSVFKHLRLKSHDGYRSIILPLIKEIRAINYSQRIYFFSEAK